MNVPTLPKDVWIHIRRFSGDTCYEPTPTAKLMHSVEIRNDPLGQVHYPFGRDGYASTFFVTKGDVRFLKPSTKCDDTDCPICAQPTYSCERAVANRPWPVRYLRFLHVDSEGYFIKAREHQLESEWGVPLNGDISSLRALAPGGGQISSVVHVSTRADFGAWEVKP